MTGGRERTTPARIWYACLGNDDSAIDVLSGVVCGFVAVAVDACLLWRMWLRHDEQTVLLSSVPMHCQSWSPT